MASRYWVGGTAAWDGTAGSKWALTSGGAGGQAVPTSADDVFFTNLSTGTCTISTGNTGAKSITCTGFTGTLAGTAAISVSGLILLVTGMTFSYTGVVTLLASGLITSAGKTFGGLTINGAAITIELADALTVAVAGTTTLTQGNIYLSGNTLSTGIFSSSNTNTRELQFGAQDIVLTSTTAATTILNMATVTGFSQTGSGGFRRSMGATATVVFGTTGGTAFNDVSLEISGGASALTITAGSYFENVSFTGTSTVTASNVNISGDLTLAAGGTYTSFSPTFLSGSQTFNSLGKTLGNVTINGSTVNFTLGADLTLGAANTFTLTAGTLTLAGFTLSTGIFSSSGSSTRAISFGAGNIALTSTTAATTILSMATISNFTYTGTGGFTRVQSATATIECGNTAGLLGTNAPNFTVTSGASDLTITGVSAFKAFTLTGSTCSVIGSLLSYGTLTVASGGTYTSFSPVLLTTQSFTSFGKTFLGFQVNGSGITVTLSDALTVGIAGAFTLTTGTIDLNGFTLSAGFFSSSNSNTRVITFGTANIALTSTSAATTILLMATATNFTYTGTGGFTRNMAATATVEFGSTAGGTTSNAPNLTVSAGASALTITANSWFNNLDFTGSTSTVSNAVNIAGNLTLATGGTYTAVVPTYRDTGTLTNSGRTLSALTVNGSGITVTCADALTTTGALTLTDGTLKLKNGVTSTVDSLVTTGTTLKYLESSTAASQATISDTTGTNTVTYLSIKDSNATGGAVFDASSATNVDAGNNTGWLGLGGRGNFFVFFM